MDFIHFIQLPPAATLSPLLLALCMAVGDCRTRRIPNYLTFGGALAGLVFQAVVFGWAGLAQAILGWLLGVALLVLPFLLGGMGAGDVKALAALGAWLGPKGIFTVFCYMGLAGGILSLGVLLWNKTVWRYLRRIWVFLLFRIHRRRELTAEQLKPDLESTSCLPYGVAIALGMVAYVKLGNFF